MTELPRVNPPQPGASIPPVRPSRATNRDRKKDPGARKRGRDRHDEKHDDHDSPAAPSEDDPNRGVSINVRV